MRRTLLALDLDGTALAAREDASAHHLQAFGERLAAAGIEVIVATARPAPDVARLLGDGSGIQRAVCANGACAVEVSGGRLVALLGETLLADRVVRAFSELESARNEWAFLFGGWREAFAVTCVNEGDPALRAIVTSTLARGRAVRFGRPAPEALPGALAAGLLVASERVDALVRGLAERPDLRGATVMAYEEVALPAWHWVECVPPTAGKASGLGAIEPRWETGEAWRVAAGNSDSDVPLLEQADLAVCPADAMSSARAAAHIVAPVPSGEPFTSWLGDHLTKAATA